jgi:hypothetical protein
MNVYDIETWCRAGNGGTIGRTLLLPLSHPQAWEPAPLPAELAGLEPMPGRPLAAARKVLSRLGYAIAVGFAVLAERPEEPFAHAFNVRGRRAADLALAGHEVLGYWGYVPTREQLAIDSRLLAMEAPGPEALSASSRVEAATRATPAP